MCLGLLVDKTLRAMVRCLINIVMSFTVNLNTVNDITVLI